MHTCNRATEAGESIFLHSLSLSLLPPPPPQVLCECTPGTPQRLGPSISANGDYIFRPGTHRRPTYAPTATFPCPVPNGRYSRARAVVYEANPVESWFRLSRCLSAFLSLFPELAKRYHPTDSPRTVKWFPLILPNAATRETLLWLSNPPGWKYRVIRTETYGNVGAAGRGSRRERPKRKEARAKYLRRGFVPINRARAKGRRGCKSREFYGARFNYRRYNYQGARLADPINMPDGCARDAYYIHNSAAEKTPRYIGAENFSHNEARAQRETSFRARPLIIIYVRVWSGINIILQLRVPGARGQRVARASAFFLFCRDAKLEKKIPARKRESRGWKWVVATARDQRAPSFFSPFSLSLFSPSPAREVVTGKQEIFQGIKPAWGERARGTTRDAPLFAYENVISLANLLGDDIIYDKEARREKSCCNDRDGIIEDVRRIPQNWWKMSASRVVEKYINAFEISKGEGGGGGDREISLCTLEWY